MSDTTVDVSAAAPDVREALARAFAEHHARKVVYAIDYEHADVALTALVARPASAVNAADVDVWAEWLFDIGYPFDISWPENPPPVDHAALARLWNARENWCVSDHDAEACVRDAAGLTVADERELAQRYTTVLANLNREQARADAAEAERDAARAAEAATDAVMDVIAGLLADPGTRTAPEPTNWHATHWHLTDGRCVSPYDEVTYDDRTVTDWTPDESCISGAAEHARAAVDDEDGGDERR